MGVIVVVYFNKVISLPAPLLYCVFDRFVLLHKIPNTYRFYPYFSMFISVFDLTVICTPNGKTAEPEYSRRADRKPKKHGEIWIKTANIGDFMEQNEAIKDTIQQRCW